MSFPRRFALLCFTVALAGGCGGGPRVRAQTSADADFGAYRTIAFAGDQPPPEGYERATLTSTARDAAREGARATLMAKGWRRVSVDEADVVMYAGVGRRELSDDVGGATPYQFEYTVRQGAIVLQAFDRVTQRPVWQGQVSATIRPPYEDPEKIRAAVSQLLDAFPVPGGTADDDG
ncbi:MAG: DUF4136 domain-containing protein [Myxococcota bacterium]